GRGARHAVHAGAAPGRPGRATGRRLLPTGQRPPRPLIAGKTAAGKRPTEPRRADSAFMSADRRPTVAAPGGQERRCPPYESAAHRLIGSAPHTRTGAGEVG